MDRPRIAGSTSRAPRRSGRSSGTFPHCSIGYNGFAHQLVQGVRIMATVEEVRAQASSALAAGEYGKALSLALLVQRHFPGDIQTTRLLGKIHLETRSLTKAAASFRTAVDVDPEDIVSWSALAIVAEEEGDLEKALENFERALEIDPTSVEVSAEVTRLRGELALSRPPRPESSMHSMARGFIAEGKFESAVPWLQEAIRLSPESTTVALALARALWQSWRPREAREVAREVLAKHPNCLKALAIVAASSYSAGGADGRSALEKTRRLNPGNDVARSFFEAGGLPFPEEPPVPEIPDSEVREAMSVPGSDSFSPEGATAKATWNMIGANEVQNSGANAARPSTPPEGSPAETNPLVRRLAALRMESAADATHEDATEHSEVSAAHDGDTPQQSAENLDRVGGVEVPEQPGLSTKTLAQLATAAGSQITEDHINAGASYAEQGLLEEAVAEYRAVLKSDPTSAQNVIEALLALAEMWPDNVKVRWLTGDALAADGKFRRAMEQYLHVLRVATSEAESQRRHP